MSTIIAGSGVQTPYQLQNEKPVNKNNGVTQAPVAKPENKPSTTAVHEAPKDVKAGNTYKAHDATPNQVSFQGKASTPTKKPEPAQTSKAPQTVAAGGIFQELSYPIMKDFAKTPEKGRTSTFDLSFRDKSNFEAKSGTKPTSQVYINRTSVVDKAGVAEAPPTRWKGLRLDHGENAKMGNATNWHWNQSGAGKAFKATDGVVITDHKLATSAEAALGKTMKIAKPLGRAALVVGAGLDAYSLGKEVRQSAKTGNWKNTSVEGARIAGGWAGAYAGAEAFGAAGATIGVIGGPVGIAVGGAVGGFVGGALGYWGGSSAAKYIAKKF